MFMPVLQCGLTLPSWEGAGQASRTCGSEAAMAEPAHAAHALGHPHSHGPGDAAAGTEHRVKDPVCGMSVDPHTAKHRAEHGGRPYYFCSAGCRTKFLADPARYLDPAAAAKA